MKPIALRVNAGEHTRENCPVWVDLDPGLLPEGPVAVRDETGAVIPSQVLRGKTVALCFMLSNLRRGAAQRLIVAPGEPAAVPGVELSNVKDETIEVRIAGTFFTGYHYAEKWARPFLMPIIGPYGDPITRRYPVEQVEGETRDHPHQKSFWVAWGDVNGSDHWSELEGHGRQVHHAFQALESGPVFGRMVALNRWVTNGGERLLDEQRSLIFYNTPASGRLVDLSVTFVAGAGPVTFGDTKEGGLASIRVATSMDAQKDGTIVNSYGGTNEAETWGKRAQWCDYCGPVAGRTVGISIFDTPGNFRYPTYWHVRNYGLMTANPFGLSHFTGNKACNGSHTIRQGEVFPFLYRLYFHAGDTLQANVAARFLDHVAPPTVDVNA